MSPELARRVWTWLEARAPAVRDNPHLFPVFRALAAGDRRALHAGRAVRDLAPCGHSTFARHCRRVLGQGYAHVVMAFRLDQARELLQARGYGVTQAAEAVGFGDPAVFRHAYERRFGHCPSLDATLPEPPDRARSTLPVALRERGLPPAKWSN